MKTELLTICCLASMLAVSAFANMALLLKANRREKWVTRLKDMLFQLKAENDRNAARLELTGFLWNEDIAKLQATISQKDRLLNQKWVEARPNVHNR